MRHRLGRGVVGLVAGLAAICLLSLPAAANTKNLAWVNLTGTTPGNLTFYNADDEPVASIPLPGLPCSTDSTTSTAISTTLTGSTTGTISVTLTNSCSGFVSGTNNFCSYITATLTGTYTATKTYTSTSTGTVTVLLKKNTGTTLLCHSVTTTVCTITLTGLAISGSFISNPVLPTLNNSNNITVAGGSPNGSVLVSGTAAACGVFIGANNGSASINAKWHVVH
jgi:hypothetical protein